MPFGLHSLPQQLISPAVRERQRAWRSRLWWRMIACVYSRPFIVTDRPILVIAPHPDDETLGCGGLIACKRDRGVPVRVVLVTDGRRSHDAHPELGLSRADVVALRAHETRRALEVLGVDPSEAFFLGQPDGDLPEIVPALRAQIVAALVAQLAAFQPQEVCVPHRTDNHADHRAAYSLTQEALAVWGRPVTLFEYPVWLFWWRNVPLLGLKAHELAGAFRLPLKEVASKKAAAIRVYESQAAILPPGFLDQFQAPYELFFRRSSLENGH